MAIWSDLVAQLTADARPLVEVVAVTLLRSVLPLGYALAAGAAMRRREPRARARIYSMGLGATLLLMLVPFAPIQPSPGLIRIALAAESRREPSALAATGLPDLPNGRKPPLLSTAASADRDPALSKPTPPAAPTDGRLSNDLGRRIAGTVPRWLYISAFVGWLAGTMSSLAWLGAGQLQVRAIRRRASPALEPRLLSALAAVCADAKAEAPDLLVSFGNAGPFVTGLWRPCIILPAGLVASTNDATLRAILAHEIHHIVSRDLAWTLTTRLLLALFWPQPLLWALARRWRQATEEACDRAALKQNCSPKEYARCLVSIAETFSAPVVHASAGVGMAHCRSALGRRIEQIMNYRVREVQKVTTGYTRAVLGLLALLLLAACRMVTAQAADPQDASPTLKPQAATLQEDARRVRSGRAGNRAQQELYRRDIEAAQKALLQFSTDSGEPADKRLQKQKVAAEQALTRAKRSADTAGQHRAAEMDRAQSSRGADAARQADRASEDMRSAEHNADRAARSADDSQFDRLAAERKRAAELVGRRSAHSADAAELENQEAEVKRAAELDHLLSHQGADVANQARQAAEQKLRAEQQDEKARRSSRALREHTSAEQRRLQAAEIDSLQRELASRDSELRTQLQRYTPGHPEIQKSKETTDELRRKIDSLAAAQDYLERSQRITEQQSATSDIAPSQRAEAELKAARARLNHLDKMLQQEQTLLKAERAKQIAENIALKEQVAQLKAEVERLRRQVPRSERRDN